MPRWNVPVGPALAIGALVACASAVPPPASGPIRWTAVADERVPEIVTVDPDGSERVTKIWIAVLDGQGYVRTGESRWLRNIQRDPNVVLRIGDASHRLQAAPVVDRELHERVSRAFREKYGWQDFLVHPRGAPGSNILRLVPPVRR